MEGCVFLKQTRPLGSKDKQKTNVVCASFWKAIASTKVWHLGLQTPCRSDNPVSPNLCQNSWRLSEVCFLMVDLVLDMWLIVALNQEGGLFMWGCWCFCCWDLLYMSAVEGGWGCTGGLKKSTVLFSYFIPFIILRLAGFFWCSIHRKRMILSSIHKRASELLDWITE